MAEPKVKKAPRPRSDDKQPPKPKPKPKKLGTSRPAGAGDYATAGANAAAAVTYAVVAGRAHVITGIAWSYTAAPVGSLQITDDGVVVFSIDITAWGPGIVIFPEPKKGKAGKSMVVTLSAGGTGVIGKVSVLNHWTE